MKKRSLVNVAIFSIAAVALMGLVTVFALSGYEREHTITANLTVVKIDKGANTSMYDGVKVGEAIKYPLTERVLQMVQLSPDSLFCTPDNVMITSIMTDVNMAADCDGEPAIHVVLIPSR